MHNIALKVSDRTPFFYGWVVLFCACCAGFVRQGPAVATLSIFVTPMTDEFEWSRTAISGAVSIGGVLAAIISPFLGPFIDKHGARGVLCSAILITALCTVLLSQLTSLLMFYCLFCLARLNFAGPFDLGIYTAVNNWFVKKRPRAISIVTLAQMAGLTAMPLIGFAAMNQGGWRVGWLIIGITIIAVGLLPNLLLMCRRPEDIGLYPDGLEKNFKYDDTDQPNLMEPSFTRRQAISKLSFWLLALFTFLVFPVQAGVSLHQAPHLLERGLSPGTAALVVSCFSFISGLSALLYGYSTRRIGVRFNLFLSGLTLSVGAFLMYLTQTASLAYIAAIFFGVGIGGILCVLPIVWADYFGRESFGSIRGIVLTIQISSQALGPVLSGFLRDWSNSYDLSLLLFVGMSVFAAVIGIIVFPPSLQKT